MSTFSPSAKVTPIPVPAPNKHVKYNLGMVLGVDDFTQEFAYLAGRDQWMARDLVGYGTVSGLRVSAESDSNGPQIVVDGGGAVSPRGQMIRVPAAQCASLHDWLKLDKTKKALLNGLASPPGDTVRVYVVLCYRDCPTDSVPIPGEPCRSEDELMAPSRLMDDFKLELRFDRPDQREEDAVRSFVAWLRQVEVTDQSSSVPLDDFLSELREAGLGLGSPPGLGLGSPPTPVFGSPPSSLHVHPGDVCEYLHAAFRLWVTELRPKWQHAWFDQSDCPGPAVIQKRKPEDCVMLAELELPIFIPEGSVDWQVQDPSLIKVNEEQRPYLIHLRLLQEWLLCGWSLAGEASQLVANFVERPANQESYGIVAAGIIRGDQTKRSPVYNNLEVNSIATGEITFKFDGYTKPETQDTFQYIVKAIPVANNQVKTPNVSFLEFRENEIALRVAKGNSLVTSAQLQNLELMIEVSRYPFNGSQG